MADRRYPLALKDTRETWNYNTEIFIEFYENDGIMLNEILITI